MKKLDDDWITNGTIDFEYKKYVLLAYLKSVDESFESFKLYPPFAEVLHHYKNVEQLKSGKDMLYKSFPKKLTKVDLKNFRLLFKALEEDDKHTQEVEEIVNFAMEALRSKIYAGKGIFDEVEKHIHIESIGLSALSSDQGLLLVDPDYDGYYYAYKYRLTFFEAAHERFKGLQTQFVERFKKSLGSTLEQVKIQIIRQLGLVQNFSTFLAVATHAYPYEETLLPVVKRRFAAYLEE